jgi:phosphatidylglycerophosphatase C
VKRIAFFDFDGTITTRDTMFSLIRHKAGNGQFYRGFLINLPVFAALKLKLISAQAAKEKLLAHFFKGMNAVDFQTACDRFASAVLPSLIRAGALAEIDRLKADGFEIVVVSASAENWIKTWADSEGINAIATKLEILNDRLTGKVDGLNCNKLEKVNRIKAVYDLSQFDEIYCYGDSSGDKPMLSLATKAFYKPFRKTL